MRRHETRRGRADAADSVPENAPRRRPPRARAGGLAAALAIVAVAVVAGSTLSSEPVSRLPGLYSGKAAVSPAPVEVWAVGDGADGSEAGKRVAAMIAAARPARMLYLGDVYERGTRGEFARNYASVYGALARRTLPTPGNHDWPRHAEGYDPYWERVTGRSMPSSYVTRIAGWDLLSLNSETVGPTSPQVRRLERTVASGGTCRLAFWHRPRFSAGSHGDQPTVAPFWRALRGRAALVVNGHEHNMQELRVRDGIRELISGAGGRSHYRLDRSDPRLGWSNVTRDGALRLRLRPGRADYAFVAVGGRVLRRGTATCRPAQPDA